MIDKEDEEMCPPAASAPNADSAPKGGAADPSPADEKAANPRKKARQFGVSHPGALGVGFGY